MFNLKDIATRVKKNEAPPSEARETRPLPEAKSPTLIRMMMVMMWEGTLSVLVKVRDAIDASYPLKFTKRKLNTILTATLLCSLGCDRKYQRKWRSALVCVCVRACNY